MALMRSSTDCLAPSPIASIAITEPTPMTMPSSVSTVRNRLARSARSAIFAASTSVGQQRRPPRGRRRQRAIAGRAPDAGAGVGDDLAVLDLDHALRLRGDLADRG